MKHLRYALLPLLVAIGMACASTVEREVPEPETSVHPGINDPYSERGVEEWVGIFEREGREIFDQRHEILAACNLQPASEVADIGAGTGLFVPLFSDAVGARGRVYAVDITAGFLERIQERAASEGRDNVTTVLCSERSVELEICSIDLAFLSDVYHHLEYPESSMSSVHRALRPGGQLMIVDFERIPGVSRQWILDHVRAGKAVVRSEIESFGFEFVEEIPLLDENYILRFRKTD